MLADEPSASSITVRETLNLIDSRFMATAAGVGQRHYAFWVGSGISRNRVADVGWMLARALEHLRSHVDPDDDNCPFRRALNEALEMASLTSEEGAAIRYDEPFEAWSQKDRILGTLWNSYARVLDIRVDGRTADYMLWEAVDVRSAFANVVDPDCEHICFAMLVMEGAVADIASANWDGLIEAAIARLSGGTAGLLQVVVDPQGLRGSPGRTRLLKFHGCAVLAAQDPSVYRKYLVGSQSQITDWPNDPTWTAMRNELASLATRSPTLMAGLSAQDSNIQDIFSKAKNTMPWVWPSTPEPPAYVFSDNQLGPFHKTLLKCVYRDAYETHGHEIEASALLRAYSKQMFLALILHLLTRKLIALLDYVRLSTLMPYERARLGGGLVHLRNRVADQADADCLVFIQAFIRMWSRGLSLARDGVVPASEIHYQPLGLWALQEMASDPSTASSGLPELATALGLLGDGEADGQWELTLPPNEAGRGVLCVASRGDPARAADVYFVCNAGATVQLLSGGVIGDDNLDVVIIHSETVIISSVRSPSTAPGRTGRIAPRHVSIRDVIAEAADFAAFRERFREGAVL